MLPLDTATVPTTVTGTRCDVELVTRTVVDSLVSSAVTGTRWAVELVTRIAVDVGIRCVDVFVTRIPVEVTGTRCVDVFDTRIAPVDVTGTRWAVLLVTRTAVVSFVTSAVTGTRWLVEFVTRTVVDGFVTSAVTGTRWAVVFVTLTAVEPPPAAPPMLRTTSPKSLVDGGAFVTFAVRVEWSVILTGWRAISCVQVR